GSTRYLRRDRAAVLRAHLRRTTRGGPVRAPDPARARRADLPRGGGGGEPARRAHRPGETLPHRPKRPGATPAGAGAGGVHRRGRLRDRGPAEPHRHRPDEGGAVLVHAFRPRGTRADVPRYRDADAARRHLPAQRNRTPPRRDLHLRGAGADRGLSAGTARSVAGGGRPPGGERTAPAAEERHRLPARHDGGNPQSPPRGFRGRGADHNARFGRHDPRPGGAWGGCRRLRHFSNAWGDLGRAELCDEGLSIGLNCKYTFCMSMTTIRVRRELRDELKGQARAAGLSLGDYLQKLSDKAASENRLNAARVAM